MDFFWRPGLDPGDSASSLVSVEGQVEVQCQAGVPQAGLGEPGHPGIVWAVQGQGLLGLGLPGLELEVVQAEPEHPGVVWAVQGQGLV